MPSWTCSRCRRRFGRTNQSHECRPAFPVDQYFAGRPPVQRRVYDAIVRHLERVGPIHVEAVGVGVMIKRSRTFAEVKGRRDHLVLGLLLSCEVEHPKITKVLKISTNRVAYFIDLYRVADVDRDVRDWLTEAYLSSPR